MKKKTAVFFLLFFVVGCILSSCVNQDYDMDNLDATVSVGGDSFVLPLGETSELKLGDLVSVLELDLLKQNADGTFSISFHDGWDASDQIPDLSGSLTFEDVISEEHFSYILKQSYLGNVPARQEDVVDEFHLVIGPLEIPAEMTHLDIVYLQEAYLNMSFAVENLPFDADLRLVLDIEFPKEMISDDSRVDAQRHLSLDAYFENGRIQFSPLHLVGFDFSDLDLTDHMTLDEVLKVKGNVYVENIDPENMHWIGQPVDVSMVVRLEHMQTSRVEGTLDYQLDPYELTLPFGDIPEFLQEEQIVLDLHNPHLALDVMTNLGLPILGEFELLPVYDGVADVEQAISISLAMPYSYDANVVEHGGFWIAADPDGMPEGYQFVERDLAALMHKMPEAIEVRVLGETDRSVKHVVDMDADYKLEYNCDLQVPIAFGEEFRLAFSETLTDLPPVLGQLFEMGSLGFVGEVINSFPLQMDLQLELLDANYQVIPLQKEAHQMINACLPDGSPQTTDLDLTIPLAQGAAVENLKHIRLSFSLTAPVPGMKLNADNFLKAHLAASIPGGLLGNMEEWEELFESVTDITEEGM